MLILLCSVCVHVWCVMFLSTPFTGTYVDELQEQNQRLLMVIRDISDQQERREQEMIDEK